MSSKQTEPILVTKTFLPPLKEYVAYLEKIWESRWVTNGGPFVKDLEAKLAALLGVKHVFFASNGTIAIQIALKALDITKEVITTPFSYVATTNSILWEKCTPVFVDIDSETYCIDPKKIEAAITKKTEAILAVHVYGQPCDVKVIERIAKKHNIKVIYDAAHAFDVKIGKTSVFNYGDISTLSFHATKLFHSGEGGAIITNDDALAEKIKLYRSFGHVGDDYYSIGVNGKNSEIHGAMGLAVLPHVQRVKMMRKKIFDVYDEELRGENVSVMPRYRGISYNYAYYPAVFESESVLLAVKKTLEKDNIFTRRYFYPSLNTLPFAHGEACPISESTAVRVLCLPLYHDLPLSKAREIARRIKKILAEEERKKRPTVSIGIPAHNEAGNITSLLHSIYMQNQTEYQLEKVYVNCDGCTDHTAEKVAKLQKKYKNLVLLNDGKRKGKTTRLNELYALHTSDYILTLDGDVLLDRPLEIDEMIRVMKSYPKTSVVAAHQVVLKPDTFIGKILYTYHRLWDETRLYINNGDHIANLYGSASLITKSLSKSFTYPTTITADEEYLYIKAKQTNGFKYAYKTRVLYNPVSTIFELRLQGTRFLNERYGLVSYFGEDITSLHDIPLQYKIRGLLVTFIKSPIYTLFSVALNLWIKKFPYTDTLNNQGMWQQVSTTKTGIRSAV